MKSKESDLINKFISDKQSVSKVNDYLSAAYLLMSIAMHEVDNASDILKKYGLEFKDIKYRHNRIEFEFDKLHKCYKSMIKAEGQKAFNEDCDKYIDEIHKLLELPLENE